MKYLLTILTVLLFASCLTNKEEPLVVPYEIAEVKPLPEKVEKVVVKEKEYDYIVSSVAEVEVVDGVQKYFFIKLGYAKEGIKNNMEGKIFNDVKQEELIGKFKLIEVYKNFSKALITELNFKISNDATVLFEIEKKD